MKTPRDMSQYKEQAQASRLAKKQWAEQNLKLTYEDSPLWRELASKYNTRLPSYVHPNTSSKYLKRVLTHLGVDSKEYLADCGVTTFKQLAELNPEYTAMAEVGLLLEWYNSKESK
jgi:predicted flap endonuclease-1-like 5' DNA nuclease